jgi:hypothetical protein
MRGRYEYKFVRLGENRTWFGGQAPVMDHAEERHLVIRDHAEQGWRLVQIFAPSLGGQGTALFYELIFEREVQDVPSTAIVEHPRPRG